MKPHIIGKYGEEIAARLLRAWYDHVYDVRHKRCFQELSIDFIGFTQQQVDTIEVKTERNVDKSGCITFEEYRIYYKDTRFKVGWGWFSNADKLLVIGKENWYFIDLQEVRDWVTKQAKENPETLRKQRRHYKSNGAKTLFFLLVPLEEIQHEKGIHWGKV